MKKIALVYDIDGWAWCHMAHGLAKYAPPEYQVELFSLVTFDFPAAGRYDAVLLFSWQSPATTGTRRVVLAAADAMTLPLGQLGTTANRNQELAAKLLPWADGVVCVNRHLERFCSQHAPSIYLPAGVDLEVFCPGKRQPSDRLRVGWCGQLGKASPKGYTEVLVPLMDELPEIDWRVNVRNVTNAMSQPEMVAWYRGLDVLLGTSTNEGSQMPLLEAAACGVPVVTTPAGDATSFSSFLFLSPWHDAETAAKTIRDAKAELRLLSELDQASHDRLGQACRREIELRADWRTLAPQWLRYVAG